MGRPWSRQGHSMAPGAGTAWTGPHQPAAASGNRQEPANPHPAGTSQASLGGAWPHQLGQVVGQAVVCLAQVIQVGRDAWADEHAVLCGLPAAVDHVCDEVVAWGAQDSGGWRGPLGSFLRAGSWATQQGTGQQAAEMGLQAAEEHRLPWSVGLSWLSGSCLATSKPTHTQPATRR